MAIGYFAEIDKALSTYLGGTNASYAIAIIILFLSLILAKLVNFIFSELLVVLGVKEDAEENHIVAILNAPMFYSVVLWGFYQSLSYIKILDSYAVPFSRVLKSIVIIFWASAISRIAHVILRKISVKAHAGMRGEMFPLMKNISSIIIWFLAAMFVLQIWSLNIMPFLASAGIAGFVIAFAAQDTISQLFSGLLIYFDKPFSVGDRIQLDTGEVGDVFDIGIRSTRIKTPDDTVVIIPNKTVANARIVNYNKPKSKIKVKISIVLDRKTDIEKAKKAVLEVLKTVEGVEKEPDPSVYFTDITDSGIKFLAVAWASNPKKQFEVKTLLIDKLYARLAKDKFAISSITEDVNKK